VTPPNEFDDDDEDEDDVYGQEWVVSGSRLDSEWEAFWADLHSGSGGREGAGSGGGAGGGASGQGRVSNPKPVTSLPRGWVDNALSVGVTSSIAWAE
jgi:hypothetical protein